MRFRAPRTTAVELAQTVDEQAERVKELLPDWAIVLITIGAIVLTAVILTWVSRRLIHRWEIRLAGEDVDVSKAVEAKRAQTLGGVLRAGSTTLIWFVAALVVLGQVGVDIGPLVAAAGIGGVALGFGAQTLVKDVIGGFFILAEEQFDVGDVIQVAGVSGVVDRITLHSTFLRDLDGRRHVVPNGEIRVSSNFTKGFSRYLMDLPVPYEEDVDRIVELVSRVTDEMRHEPEYTGSMLTGLEVLGVDDYAESQVKVKVYVDTIPGKQWVVGRELRKRIKRAYDEADVSIPYPHRELIIRGGKSEDVHPDERITASARGENPKEDGDRR